MAKPSTIVHVAPGTYKGSFSTSANGTASGRIYFVSDVKWGAKLVPASSTSDSTAWTVGGSYVTVDGFELDGQSSLGWRIGFWVSGNNIVIANNHVHHIGRVSACDGNGGGGIATDGYSGQGYHDILNNVVHHIGPGNPGSCGGFNGIYMESHDWTVKNNLSYQSTGDGITAYHDSLRGKVINNTVFRNGRGIVLSGGGFYHLSQGGPYTIQNNIVYDNNPNSNYYVGGIGLSDSLASGGLVANNFVAGNGGTALSIGSGLATQSNNITSGSPGFVNYVTVGSGNYHRTSTSQLVDTALSTNAPANDLDGTARPQGAGIDIGSYEYKTP